MAVQLGPRIRGAHRVCQKLCDRRTGGNIIERELKIGGDHGQQIVEVMRDTAGQLAQRTKFLCAQQPCLGQLSLSDVLTEPRAAGRLVVLIGMAAEQQKALGAVIRGHTKGDIENRHASTQAVEGFDHLWPVLVMDGSQKLFLGHRNRHCRLPQHGGHIVRAFDPARLRIPFPGAQLRHALRLQQIVCQMTELLIALMHGDLGGELRGAVPDHCQDGRLTLDVHAPTHSLRPQVEARCGA